MSTGPTPAPSPTPSGGFNLSQLVQALGPLLQAFLAVLFQHLGSGNPDPGAVHAAMRGPIDQHYPILHQTMQSQAPQGQTSQQAPTGQQTQASPQGQQQQ